MLNGYVGYKAVGEAHGRLQGGLGSLQGESHRVLGGFLLRDGGLVFFLMFRKTPRGYSACKQDLVLGQQVRNYVWCGHPPLHNTGRYRLA